MSTILLIILIILICAALPTLPYRMHRTPGQFVPDRRDASRGHNASVMGTSTQRTWLDRLKMRPAYEYNLAGRYQGYYRFPNSTGSFEVFWRADGWWWWPRVPGSPPKREAVGPFVTSTEAYSNATMQRLNANDQRAPTEADAPAVQLRRRIFATSYKKRVEALRRHYNMDAGADVPLYVMPGQANLITEHKLLIQDIAEQLGTTNPVVVVLDTLNKSLVGSENKDVDMGAYVRAAEAIRDKFGCVVIIVHHCGYDDTRPRGHSSLPGAVDAQLAVVRQEEVVTVTVEMMRDGPEDLQVVSEAQPIEVGQDQNGKVLTSLVMVPSEADPATAGHGMARGLNVFYSALKAALASDGEHFQPEAGMLPVRAVPQWKVRDRFYKTYAEAEEDAKKRQAKIQKAFVRALSDGQSRGLFRTRRTDSGEAMLWLPERGEK